MSDRKKWLGEERREKLLSVLEERSEPQSGGSLAKELNVSRQVIVQDITLLKAKGLPILSTSQGYVLSESNNANSLSVSREIACIHTPQQTEEELFLLVDHGVTVKDVKVNHPVYGMLTSSVNVSSRKEVKHFLEKIKQTKASYLLELTGGIHFHTLEAKSEEDIDDALKALSDLGFLNEKN